MRVFILDYIGSFSIDLPKGNDHCDLALLPKLIKYMTTFSSQKSLPCLDLMRATTSIAIGPNNTKGFPKNEMGAAALPKLTHIDLYTGNKSVLEKLPNISSVNSIDWKNNRKGTFGDNSLDILSKKYPELESLDLSECRTITDIGIAALVPT